MLRFDIAPVCSNAYRFQAAVTLAVSAIYFFTPYQWVAIILALGGALRGFVSPHKCPSYLAFSALTRKLGMAKPINAGAKMFADKLVAIAGTIMFVTWLMGSEIGLIPAAVLMVFAFIDLVSGFCAACWAYAMWYKVRGT
ncbi:DUF4395 family protein [Thauera mechernichensis]|uniref:DUF4395 family protein n=1 Tax=Thauera mechernichensis TaxID=82788 RepID=A0ABW3WJ36_9RHOO|nr:MULTISPECIES: DUF4395 family protein [Thauera]ENO74830.1 hypothetical protein B447_20875 [Thauera sp. 27]ENO93061.1 hypothetical protein C662_08599 [Thauera sp. 28]MDG3066541.1 DUF4395 family protein [Thauera mechernichensis]WBL65488.1 DUF4395 domain-containing protein [Thauera sp. WB-2]HRJ24905.1 DUF4395 family protein [Thauera sp.]